MNLVLLSTDIVSRVQHSPDSPLNLATLVAGMIEQELRQDALLAAQQSAIERELEADILTAKLSREFGLDLKPTN